MIFFFKLIPLYLIIILGYIAGKKLEVNRESIAPLLIFIVVPVVNFKGVFDLNLGVTTLVYPLYFFCICSFLAVLFYKIGRLFFKDREYSALLALCSSFANVGYYGIPLLISLYGEEILGTAVILIFGFVLFETSVAYLIAARGKHSMKDALRKTLKLPTNYAVLLAVLANWFYHQRFVEAQSNLWLMSLIDSTLIIMDKFVGALTFLGMCMVGLGLAKLSRWQFDWKFLSLTMFAKFVCFPLLIWEVINLDQSFFHLLTDDAIKVLKVFAFVPIGANTVTFATQFKLDTDKVSIALLVSNLLSLILIPLVLQMN